MPRPAFDAQLQDRWRWLQSLSLESLRQLAKTRGLSNADLMNHSQLIEELVRMNISANPLSTPKSNDVRTQ